MKILFFLLSLLFAAPLSAQTPIDSLRAHLERASDVALRVSVRVDTLVRVDTVYVEKPPLVTVSVTDHGATGDDAGDDSDAFRAALSAVPDSGGVLYIPAGTYYLTPVGHPIKAGLLVTRRNVTIRGEGSASVVKMNPTIVQQGGFGLIYMNGSAGSTLRDFVLDGSMRDGHLSDEQSHCLELWHSTDILVRHMRFQNCKGDGIRLLGVAQNDKPWLNGVVIDSSTFYDNGRSGIAVQRGTRNVRIANNHFERISDQSIDFEPTGTQGTLYPEYFTIEDNIVIHSSRPYAITLGGNHIIFRRNRIENGSIFVYNAGVGGGEGFLIEGNTILGSPYNRPLEIRMLLAGVRILNNHIENREAVPSGAGTLTVTMSNGFSPREVLIQGNTLIGKGRALHMTDAEEVAVIENTMIGDGTLEAVFATNVLLMGRPREGLVVRQNIMKGFTAPARLAQRTNGEAWLNPIVEDNTVTPAP